MSHRINARLDAELARKLDELSARTGKNASAVIKAALEAYYERMHAGDAGPKLALERAGFIACGSAAADLSTTYKASLSQSLGSKT
jgi:predicted transcriptional regulator